MLDKLAVTLALLVFDWLSMTWFGLVGSDLVDLCMYIDAGDIGLWSGWP